MSAMSGNIYPETVVGCNVDLHIRRDTTCFDYERVQRETSGKRLLPHRRAKAIGGMRCRFLSAPVMRSKRAI